jgi:hypothetical protein
MKTRKILSAVIAFVSLVVMTGCTPETSAISDSEDEVTVSVKASFETTETEKTAEATEATTVLSTKDGITLENAPKMNADNLGALVVKTIIADQEYDTSPVAAKSFLLIDGQRVEVTDEEGRNYVQSLEFDTLEPIFTIDSIGTLSGITIAGKVDGETLQGRTYLNALKEKYPNVQIGYDNEGLINNTSTFSLSIENASLLSVILKEPVVEKNEYGFGKFNGQIILNATNIENSKFESDFNQLLPCFTNIENSAIRLKSVGDRVAFGYTDRTENMFSKVINCDININLSLQGGVSINNNEILLGYGQHNKIQVNLENMSYSGRAVEIEIGGMLATEILIISHSSSYNIYETAPNFNSTIVNNLAGTEELEDSNLSYSIQTIDGDNCPVIIQSGYIIHDDGSPISYVIDAEIQTGGVLEKIPSDFLLNAPSDGSVYGLSE